MRDQFHIDPVQILAVPEQHLQGGLTMDLTVDFNFNRGTSGKCTVIAFLAVADQKNVIGTFQGIFDQEFPGSGKSRFREHDAIRFEIAQQVHGPETVLGKFFDQFHPEMVFRAEVGNYFPHIRCNSGFRLAGDECEAGTAGFFRQQERFTDFAIAVGGNLTEIALEVIIADNDQVFIAFGGGRFQQGIVQTAGMTSPSPGLGASQPRNFLRSRPNHTMTRSP